jgi:hypothetical protein
MSRVADRAATVCQLSLDPLAALLRPAPNPAYDVWCTPYPVGKHVSLELTLPHWGEPIVVGGEVRWARTSEEDDPHRDGIPGVGVKFLKPPLYVVAALDNFVRSDAPGT